jgi:hypothetical protein
MRMAPHIGKPGTYANDNIIASGGPQIGAGTATVDILGVARKASTRRERIYTRNERLAGSMSSVSHRGAARARVRRSKGHVG